MPGSRLRTRNATIQPHLIVGTNPGGQGHLRLYERFIVKQSRSCASSACVMMRTSRQSPILWGTCGV